MVYRCLPLVLLALFATTGLPLQAQQKDHHTSLIAELEWARLRIVSGRIVITDMRAGDSQTAESSNPLVGIAERISISMADGLPQLHYELTDRQQLLAVDFSPTGVVHVVRQPQPGSQVVPMEYRQQSGGDVVLLVGDEGARVQVAAPGFWQLMLTIDEPTARELANLLHVLRPNWQLEQTAAGIERALYRQAEFGPYPDRARWAELVSGLGSQRFSQRLAAEQQLAACGATLLPYLRNLPRQELDAQQRWHVDHLLKRLSADVDDTPDRVASWLIDDPQVWLGLLARAEGSGRQLARGQLSRVLNRDIDFDPQADDAARREQLERLHQQIATLPRK